MKSQNSYNFIYIGLLIRMLRNLTPSDNVDVAISSLVSLRKFLEKVGFIVSVVGMRTMSEVQDKLGKMEPGTNLGALQKEIVEGIIRVEPIVFAEAETKSVYTFPERRFNAEYLLQKPEKLLKPGSFDSLSEMAQLDLSAACRCILFGEATASAFHILRAVEETLRQYYFIHKKRNRLKNPMWGPMVAQLRAKSRNKPPKVLLDSLELVRQSYRNPTQHPDSTYDIESSQDLMGVCLDVLSKMTRALQSS